MPSGVYPRRVKRHAVTQPLDKPYRYIPLTQGKVALVDERDFEWLSQWNWYAHWKKTDKTFYARRSSQAGTVQMHRVILNCDSSEETDHRNHDGLDNRRNNLRKCSSSKNAMNRRIGSRNTSGFKGVYWQKGWRARIDINGYLKHLGRFPSAKLAAHAYDAAARRYFGQFAWLNFNLPSEVL